MTARIPVRFTPTIDLAIAAWLDAKSNRSGSKKTLRAYTDRIASFRQHLQRGGLDLDGDTAAVALASQAWAATLFGLTPCCAQPALTRRSISLGRGCHGAQRSSREKP